VSQAFIQIYKEGGIRGLWRGCVVNVQRAALVSLGGNESFFFNIVKTNFSYLRFSIFLDLATYDLVKQYFMLNFNFQDDYKVHTVARYCFF
jgi:hypothetical protein